jgi:hypothetical protein
MAVSASWISPIEKGCLRSSPSSGASAAQSAEASIASPRVKTPHLWAFVGTSVYVLVAAVSPRARVANVSSRQSSWDGAREGWERGRKGGGERAAVRGGAAAYEVTAARQWGDSDHWTYAVRRMTA